MAAFSVSSRMESLWAALRGASGSSAASHCARMAARAEADVIPLHVTDLPMLVLPLDVAVAC